MSKFEWDEDKNRRNTQKHKVNFEEAKTVFDDPSAIELEASRNGEYRIIRIGKTATGVYTLRGLVVRLISARQASKEERNLYIEKKFKNQDDGGSNG